jgi:oxygen-independent coproporphyrinogen-3 oxidase
LVSRGQLEALRGSGFQRISYGVQDFDPVVQAAIGRPQPEAVVREAVALARESGFEGINIDLIYGLPAQTAASFERTLDAALALEPDRVPATAMLTCPGAAQPAAAGYCTTTRPPIGAPWTRHT